jgi:hypothetical protein
MPDNVCNDSIECVADSRLVLLNNLRALAAVREAGRVGHASSRVPARLLNLDLCVNRILREQSMDDSIRDAAPAARSSALEALALEEFKLGHLTDEFLKAHDVYEPYTLDDLEREPRDLQRLGF